MSFRPANPQGGAERVLDIFDLVVDSPAAAAFHQEVFDLIQ